MAVHLTRIYTRTGDDGTTGLADFSRVSKNDPRLVAYADCDETNATLGLVMALGSPSGGGRHGASARIQNELFDLGADLATPVVDATRLSAAAGDPGLHRPARERLRHVQRRALTALTSFILPGGTAAGALLHLARTVARRAERSAWALRAADPDHSNPLAATYLNRLSDLLVHPGQGGEPGR